MSKEYRLVPSRIFLKDLERLPAEMKPRIDKALLGLKKDPHSTPNIKKLRNVDIGEWRLKIGHWRLRYDIVDDAILLHVVRKRKDVYRDK